MSRTPANPGFKLLLDRQSRIWNEPVALADIAAAIGCTRQALGAYINGRRALPYIAMALADFFNLSVPALRRRLALTNLGHNNNQEKHHETRSTTSPTDQPRNAGRPCPRQDAVRRGPHA